MRSTSIRLAMAILALATMPSAFAQAPQTTPTPVPREIPRDSLLKPWKGDFDAMLERRLVRVLATPSRTFFFNELGRERGYAADIVRAIEKQLNTTLGAQLGKRPLTFVIIPTTREKLLTGVADGLGDIAVNLGVTDTRKQLVDFLVAPDAPLLSEVVLTGPASPVINTVDDLAGKTVHVRPSSTYHESLVALNERFKKDAARYKFDPLMLSAQGYQESQLNQEASIFFAASAHCRRGAGALR